MSENTIQLQIEDINRKLDFITEQMKEQQVRQREIQELKSDLSIIGKDVFEAAVEELEEVAPYFDTKDLLFLIKKLLRNTRNLSSMLSQMESMENLFQDLKPLGKQVFDETLDVLNELDKKGYFEFFREAAEIVDTVVTSFTADDIRLLRENIVSILGIMKSITQPEMLASVNNALGYFKKLDMEVEEDISLMRLLKEMRDPEVKRGIYFMLGFVKNMAKND